MAEKLQSGLAPGSVTGIEQVSESRLLQDFIKNNWTLVGIAAADIDFGAHPSRTKKAITLNCYRIFSNIYDKDVGARSYYFDVPVAIDVYVRDIKAEGLRDEPAPKLVQIDNYLRDFVSVNRLGLRDKGINHIDLSRIEYPQEPAPVGIESQRVWYHLVTTVRMYYHLFRVQIP